MLNQFGAAALALGIVLWAGASLNIVRAQNVEDAVMSAQNSFGGIELASFHLKPKEKPKPKLDPNAPPVASDGTITIPPAHAVIRRLTPDQMRKFAQIAVIVSQANNGHVIDLGGDDAHFIFWAKGSIDKNGSFHVYKLIFGKFSSGLDEDCSDQDMGFAVSNFKTGEVLKGGCNTPGLRYPDAQEVLREVIHFWMSQDLTQLRAKFNIQ